MAKARKVRPKAAVKPTARRRPPAADQTPARERPQSQAAAAPAPAAPQRKPTYPEAIRVYEHGIEALQRRAWSEAAERFRELMTRFPEERELHDRAQLYLRVCERELAAAAPEPRTREERLVAATVALNAGQHQRALELLNEILREDPASDLAEYMSAVVLATTGQLDQALARLQRAVELNPENRNLARQDSDLEALHEHEEFRRLMEAAVPAPRRRKSRNGR